MADSRVVPDVLSTAVRIAVAASVVERIEAMGARIGLPRDELIELMLRRSVDGENSTAAQLWESYTAGQTQSPSDVAAALTQWDVGVRGFKLSSPSPDRAQPPWTRSGTGAELSWSPERVWPVVRGLWRMTPSGVSHVVALKLGHALGVYRVQGWGEHDGRKYALGGSIITAEGRLLDAETGSDTGPASEVDQAVYATVTAAPIIAAGRQPVVRLSHR